MTEGAAGTSPTGDRPTLSDADIATQTPAVEATPAPSEPAPEQGAAGDTGSMTGAGPAPAPSGSVMAEDTSAAAQPGGGKPPAPPTIDWDNLPQEVIDALNKRKATSGERAKIKADVDKARTDTRAALDSAIGTRKDLNKQIPYSETEKQTLRDKIAAVQKQVSDARAAVAAQQGVVDEAQAAANQAKQTITEHERKYGDKKKELGQIAPRIKDSLKQIERLLGESQNAVNQRDWVRAFYKLEQMQQAIVEDADLRSTDPDGAYETLITSIDKFEDRVKNGKLEPGRITRAKNEAQDAQRKLENESLKLKQLKDELKRKEESLDESIDFLTPDPAQQLASDETQERQDREPAT